MSESQPFVTQDTVPELSPLAALKLYDGKASSAGVVTGIGVVHGREYFVANDATVKGGSYYPMTVKKHIRAQKVMKTTTCLASI